MATGGAGLGAAAGYTFERGFPTSETVERAYDQADLSRAIQAYRFFFPTVSGLAIFKGSEAVGLRTNEVFGILDTEPRHVGFTLNCDTPYAPILLDLRAGPLVIELPPGPLICVALDVNQRWVADMGLPGPDQGNGGRHVLLPPGWDGDVPDGLFSARSTTYRVLAEVRSLPVDGDLARAHELIKAIEVRPLQPAADWKEPVWLDVTSQPQDITPCRWETTLDYWRHLHEVIDSEPPLDEFRILYGELAALGIAKGRPFSPDERMARILTDAAIAGNAQMRVQSFADRRADRVVWADRQWEWASLRFENGDFYADGYLDVDAREKWFYQAIAASPAMFRRSRGAGSLYWLGLRDREGRYLDGGRRYRLSVPQPVPGRLFWSITVYDSQTRSQIQTGQDRAALRSLFELRDVAGDGPVDLHFGPTAPGGPESRWIETIPGRGWFVYFRIYGPEDAAFDGTWKPADFAELT